jgi:hypothetical protein
LDSVWLHVQPVHDHVNLLLSDCRLFAVRRQKSHLEAPKWLFLNQIGR